MWWHRLSSLCPGSRLYRFRFSVKRLLIIHKLTNWFVAAETEFGISRAQPGKAVPPVNTSFSWFTGGPKAHEELP
jgi:hypothetical protein